MIKQPTPQNYDTLLLIWEEAVRSTHHFLTEEDIQFYKPLVRNEYLSAVSLYITRNDDGQITAFMGLGDNTIEMLFVHPHEQGHGYGKKLIEFAIHEKQIRNVDVNEQNEKALRFYLNRGFKVIAQDATDSMGKPFPILHLQLNPIQLRKAESEDLDALYRVFEQSVRNTCANDYTPSQLQAWIEKATPNRWKELFQSDFHFILAEDTETFQVIGFTSVNAKGYLHSLYVHSHYQRKGVATLLLRQAEAYAHSHQVKSIHSEVSITARPFFEQQGFTIENRQVVTINRIELTNFIMSKTGQCYEP